MHSYRPKGVCSNKIEFDIQDGILVKCEFKGGCDGNLIGISRLVTGRKVDEVIELLKGIQCQNNTSCPDQLALALQQYAAEK